MTEKEQMERYGFTALRLTNKGLITGTIIAPLKAMSGEQAAELAQLLQEAASRIVQEEAVAAVWLLGDILMRLGFTVEASPSDFGRT